MGAYQCYGPPRRVSLNTDLRQVQAWRTSIHMIIDGQITVPGDKSLTHRALMFAAAARGESRVRGLLPGADCRSTAAVLRALGVRVPELPASGAEVRLDSSGIQSWSAPSAILDCGNSGTTARLMMGMLAGRPFCSTLTGDDSLRSRPMRRITDPLSRMGARFQEQGNVDRLPIEVCGGDLKELRYRSPKASAQIKSAVILAGLSGKTRVSIWEPIQSRDHTERMLRAMGADLHAEQREEGWFVELSPRDQDLAPLDMEVPGDPSSAAFLVALALLASDGTLRISGVGLNPSRTGFFDAVRRMGGIVTVEDERLSGGEPVGDLIARPGDLRGIEVTGSDVPAMIDELPILACLAARADGETRITGADELRAKESDRIAALVSNLRAIGVEADELADGLVIQGTHRPLTGRVQAHHDHRIAMAFGVLAALPETEISIDTPEVVDVSFPGFWELLRELTGEGAAR